MYKMWALTKALEATRFQLFGDTIHTAALMESSGPASCIQISEDTADLLIAAGKFKWIKQTEIPVQHQKGGPLKTYFLEIRHGLDSSSNYSSEDSTLHSKEFAVTTDDQNCLEKNSRQIDWNFEVMSHLLKQVVLGRQAEATVSSEHMSGDLIMKSSMIPFDDVTEIIEMPVQQTKAQTDEEINAVELDVKVSSQLRDFLHKIASMYRENPFHNCKYYR
jgi:hypothetical protein